MAFLLPNKLIMVEMVLSHKGRTATIPAALDTGASGFGFIDERVAEELLLPVKSSIKFAGVGGQSRQGWVKEIENAHIKENPACNLQNFELVSGDMGIDPFGIKMLVGLEFIQSTDMTIRASKNGITIGCGPGPHVALKTSGMGDIVMLGTGAVIAGAALLAILFITARR